jgi:hypothetical protein
MGAMTRLCLDDNYLRLAGCKAICDALQSNTTVTSLSMAKNGFRANSAQPIAVMLRGNGARFSVQRDALLSFYEQHDPQFVDHVDQFLQEYSAQEMVDWCQEEYGSSPTTTPKANGAMTSLNLANNRLRTSAKVVAKPIEVTMCTPATILAPFSCLSDFSINCCCLL